MEVRDIKYAPKIKFYFNKGEFGKVYYFYKNRMKKVYKEFGEKVSLLKARHEDYLKYMEYLSSVNPDLMEVPDILYYGNDGENDIRAYEYSYFPGDKIETGLKNVSIGDIGFAVKDLDEKIDMLDDKVYFFDTSDQNILYCDGEFKLIDTDLHSAPFETLDETYYGNNKGLVNRALIASLFDSNALLHIRNNEMGRKILFKVEMGQLSFNDLINFYEDLMYKLSGEYISLGKDINRLGSKVLKR